MLRVLIADDEQVIADSLALIVGQFGYETTAVYSGENAVAVAGVWGPDVVISDVVMAGMSGIEAGIQIRQMLPGCRVVLFSGQTSTGELIRRAISEGHYFEVLTKPVHPKALFAYLTGSVSGF
jgi:CheY-like chemotaxis protein